MTNPTPSHFPADATASAIAIAVHQAALRIVHERAVALAVEGHEVPPNAILADAAKSIAREALAELPEFRAAVRAEVADRLAS